MPAVPAALSWRQRIRARLPRTNSAHFQNSTLGIILALPLLAVLIGLLAYPMLYAAYMSFMNKQIGIAPKFVGLANYVELLQDPIIPSVILNTLLYTVAGVTCKAVIGFLVALVLNEQLAFRNFFRGWVLLPWVLPALVVGLTWRWMFNETAGVINFVLLKLHIISLPISWLASKELARVAVIVTNVWHGFPFFVLALLSGMQSIPLDLYEAAQVDGATMLQRIRYIMLPWLKPVFAIVIILSSISTFNDFSTVYVVTGGGPSDATHIIATYAYKVGFEALRFGYGSAVSLVSVPFMIIFIWILATRMWREDE
jgi:multiple sugar transport system permease protein